MGYIGAFMSQIPTLQVQAAKSCLHSQQEIFEIYNELLSYFEKTKNPKIFLFFIHLANSSITKKDSKIFFNILEMSYKYDVCEKTIKLWIAELERLALIKFNYKHKQLYFVDILNYQHSKIYQNRQDSKAIPTRFYKNIQQIMRNVSKTFAHKTLLFEYEQWNLKQLTRKDKKISTYKIVLIELQNKRDCNLYTSLTYQDLTQKALPPINNPYHLRIIKSNIKKSLELMSS